MSNVDLYVFEQQDRLKIGISKNPRSRCKQVISASGLRTVVSWTKPYSSRKAARAKEAALHKYFKKRRMLGEWFTDLSLGEVQQALLQIENGKSKRGRCWICFMLLVGAISAAVIYWPVLLNLLRE